MTDEAFGGSDPARPGGRPNTARALLPLSGIVMAACAGIAAWLVLTPQAVREPDRTYAMWHLSQAVTSYTNLRQALTAAPDPDANEISALARTFARSVERSHDADPAAPINADPAIKALVQRLDTDRQQTSGSIHETGQAAPADDTAELLRLTQAANREGAVQAERDNDAADTRHWLAAGLIAALTAAGLLLLSLLDRASRTANAARRDLEDTGVRLQDALEKAARADAAKARFVTSASHDLRAPVNEVLRLTDALLEERLPPAQRETVSKISDTGKMLSRALDDVMDFTTLESGELILEMHSFSPEATMASVAAGIEEHARAKGLSVVTTTVPGLPRLMVGDTERIGRILYRLAANAVRFTQKGGVSFQVLCVERDAERATIEWVVSDTGVGINASRLDRLFGPEGEEGSERRAGMGLGLDVCKRLVSRMGGSLTVESVLGEGTRFRVRLPLRIERRGAAGERAPAAPSAAPLRDHLRALGRRPKLLMAEDTPAGQFILRQLLAREGIAPDMVGDGRAAVLAAEADRYDVICLDLRMPEMDGLEAARRIRSGRGPSANTPIIAVTANPTPEDVRACKDAGMTMFVAKPVRRETFLNAILAALTGKDVTYTPRIGPKTVAAQEGE